MDRVIKFRGKVKVGDRWIVGQYCQRGHFITWDEGNHLDYYVNEDTVGQYTGMKDMIGQEIYEGDILSWHNGFFKDTEFRGKVFFQDAAFWVKTEELYQGYFCPDYGEELLMDIMDNVPEVIGNIHDNPELLEERK